MDSQLLALIDLQSLDARIATLEAEAARLPREIEAIQTALADAQTSVAALRARLDKTKKDLRAKEKDLEVVAAKRAKGESRLWEVKTNKEYSAVLVEIEEIKQEKGRTEEEILSLMESQERLQLEIRDAETRLKARETEAARDEAAVRQKLSQVQAELEGLRGERASRARELPGPLLTSYERILRARGGLAVVVVTSAQVCGGCRVTIRPQAVQELRASATLMLCENCGRYLYWQESA